MPFDASTSTTEADVSDDPTTGSDADDERVEAEDDLASFFEERSFGRHLPLGDDPALVVIDVMNAFTDPEYDLGADLDEEVAAIAGLTGAAQDNDVPIVYVYSAFDDRDVEGATLWIRKQGGANALRAGSEAVAIDDRLTPAPEDDLMVKKQASAFFATDLVSRLNALGVDTVVLAGCTTSGCVRASAVDAVQYGFVPVVPIEAVGDREERAHRQSLFDLEMKYADVLDLSAVRKYIETGADPV